MNSHADQEKSDSCGTSKCLSGAIIAMLVLASAGAGFFFGRRCTPQTIAPQQSSSIGARSSAATPEETARGFLEAMSRQSWDEAGRYFSIISQKARTTYGGSKVLSVGAASGVGTYPGVYVPYEIILASGETKKAKLALRNDNPDGRYAVDGGF